MTDECLTRHLLNLETDHSGKLSVNLDQRIPLLIREADCLAKLGIAMPVVTSALLSKRHYFTLVRDSLQVRAGAGGRGQLQELWRTFRALARKMRRNWRQSVLGPWCT